MHPLQWGSEGGKCTEDDAARRALHRLCLFAVIRLLPLADLTATGAGTAALLRVAIPLAGRADVQPMRTQLEALVILFGLARRTARQIEKVSPSYRAAIVLCECVDAGVELHSEDGVVRALPWRLRLRHAVAARAPQIRKVLRNSFF